MTSVLNHRMKWELVDAGVLERSQHGFLPHLLTITCSGELLEAIELVLSGEGEELFVLFGDAERAFDRVSHWSLEISYRRLDFSEALIDLLREFNLDGVCQVRLEWGLSPEVEVLGVFDPPFWANKGWCIRNASVLCLGHLVEELLPPLGCHTLR